MLQSLIFSDDAVSDLHSLIESERYADRPLHIIADSNTSRLVVPRLALPDAQVIEIAAGDTYKNIDTLAHVWASLSSGGATRNSVVINAGGGVVTDLGGFAASTFKRGVSFINLPTTLLCAVDAALGGKTGINFNGLKNEIGSFSPAEAVIISTDFFPTLPYTEFLSGYAEMLKHALLESVDATRELLSQDLPSLHASMPLEMLRQSVMVKNRIVQSDPFEQGARKTLNLGHTAAHAFESLAMSRDRAVPHGYAVAWGLVVDAILSHMRLGFDSTLLRQLASMVLDNYGTPAITCNDYDTLLELMSHDKKNTTPGQINFTLLKEPGEPLIDCMIGRDDILTALDLFRDLLHF